MDFNEWGIDAKTALAGLVGGFVAWLAMMKQLTPKQALVSVIGGAASANYATGLIMHFLSTPEQFKAGMGFAVGVFGLAIVGKIMILIESTTPADVGKWVDGRIRAALGIFKGK